MNLNFLNKILILMFFASSLHAAEVLVRGKISPAGSLDLRCDKILGLYPTQEEGGYFHYEHVRIESGCFKSEISLRDKHISEYLEPEKHPYISIKNLKISKKDSQGSVTIKGKTTEKKMNFTQNGDNFLVKFSISLKEFDLEQPSFMGAKVKDTLEIEVSGKVAEIKEKE